MIAKERKRDIKRGKEEIRRQRRREEKVGGSSKESGYRNKDNEGMKERERKFREIEGVEREGGGETGRQEREGAMKTTIAIYIN